MKLARLLLCSVFIASAASVSAAPLDGKSTAPDWSRASQMERDAWIAAFKFKNPDIDRAEVAACLDKRAGEPLFAQSNLAGVTKMCETIAALP